MGKKEQIKEKNNGNNKKEQIKDKNNEINCNIIESINNLSKFLKIIKEEQLSNNSKNELKNLCKLIEKMVPFNN